MIVAYLVAISLEWWNDEEMLSERYYFLRSGKVRKCPQISFLFSKHDERSHDFIFFKGNGNIPGSGIMPWLQTLDSAERAHPPMPNLLPPSPRSPSLFLCIAACLTLHMDLIVVLWPAAACPLHRINIPVCRFTRLSWFRKMSGWAPCVRSHQTTKGWAQNTG